MGFIYISYIIKRPITAKDTEPSLGGIGCCAGRGKNSQVAVAIAHEMPKAMLSFVGRLCPT